MRHRARRFAAPTLGILFVAALALPVSAAVSEDGVVTVSFADGDTPFAGANVDLVAYVTDFDDPIQTLTAVTGEDGIATFSGVMWEDADGPTIHLAVTATIERARIDENRCRIAETWIGTASDIESGPTVTIDIAQIGGTSSIECATLFGQVLGSGGGPVEVKSALVSVVPGPDEPAEGFPLEVEADGRFNVNLPFVGTEETPAAVSIQVVSAVTRTEPVTPSCTRQFAESGTWETTVALHEDTTLPFAEIELEEFVVRDCQAPARTDPPQVVVTDPPIAGITLPPTDAGAPTGEGTSAVPVALVAALLLLAGAGLLAATPRRRRA